jgi:hypothetical protein
MPKSPGQEPTAYHKGQPKINNCSRKKMKEVNEDAGSRALRMQILIYDCTAILHKR